MQERRILRKLDDYERFLWLPNQKNCFNQSLVVGLLPNSIDCVKLKQALNLLLNKYSILKTTIKGKKEPYYQESLDSDLVKVELVVRKNAVVMGSIEKELHKPFPKLKGPLFRARLLKNDKEDVLIFTSHHLITDGMSLNFLLTELLKMVFSEKLPSMSCLNKISLPDPVSNYSTSTKALEEKAIFNTNVLNCHTTKKDTVSIKTGLIFGKINDEKVRKIFSICKKKSVKVHSFLASCLYSAFTEFIRRSSGEEVGNILYECPVNLRNLTAPEIPLKLLGCFMATLCMEVESRDSTNFWKLANNMDIKLREKLDESLINTTVNSVASLMRNSKSFEDVKKFRRPLYPFFGLSNLGKLNDLTPFQDKIKYIFPSVALQGTFYDTYNIYCALNTFKDQIFFSLMYPNPMMKKKQANQLLSLFYEKINQYAVLETAEKKTKRVA